MNAGARCDESSGAMAIKEQDHVGTAMPLLVIEGHALIGGVAVVESDTLGRMGCVAGDVVQIEGSRATVARLALRGQHTPEASGAPAVAMDGLTRQNAGAALGDMVLVRPVPATSAISVALVPSAGASSLAEAELRHVARSLRGIALVAGDLVRVPGMGLAAREFQVLATNPASAVTIAPGTVLRIQPAGNGATPRSRQITYEDIGGLGSELQHIREMIELPLKHPRDFRSPGYRGAKGCVAAWPTGNRQNVDRPCRRRRE